MGALGSAAAYHLARRLGDQTGAGAVLARPHPRLLQRITPGSSATPTIDRLHEPYPGDVRRLDSLEAEPATTAGRAQRWSGFRGPRIAGLGHGGGGHAAAMAAEGIGASGRSAGAAGGGRNGGSATTTRPLSGRRREPGHRPSVLGPSRPRRQHGARLTPGPAFGWSGADGGGVRVGPRAASSRPKTRDLCGQVDEPHLGEVAKLPLDYSREQVTYFAPPRLADFAPERFPMWIRPASRAFTASGRTGSPRSRPPRTSAGLRSTSTTRRARSTPPRGARAPFLGEHLPGADGPIVQSRACLYELTPSRDFLLGPLVEAPPHRVVSAPDRGKVRLR